MPDSDRPPESGDDPYRAVRTSLDAHYPQTRATPGLGRHLLAELLDCERLPTQASELQRHMEQTGRLIGATIVQSVFHEFNPHGLSGVVIIAESHIAIHTWPEYRCAALDIFTCGQRLNARPGLDYLREAFAARDMCFVEIPRGLSAL